ncbi:hypothetical protein LLG46_13545 [bacterium]|nr:hypothetical protein [bacterium]
MKSIGLLSWVLVLTAFVCASAYAAGQNPALVNLELKNVTVQEGLSALFAGTCYQYTVEPGVSGRVVELKLKGITFEQALTLFTNAAGLTYTISDGIYIIGPSANAGQATRTVIAQGTAKPKKPTKSTSVKYPQETNQAQQSQPAMTQTAPQTTAQPAPPSQQVVVNQQAPVFYSQPGNNPGYYGYPQIYGTGNFGVIGGCGPLVALGGGYPYVTRFGLGAVPPPGWVNADTLRFLRNLKALLPGLHIYGPGY